MWALTGLLLVLGLAAWAAFWWFNRPKPVPVRTATVREAGNQSSVERTVLNSSGYVTARREATVSSKLTGKVVEVFIEEGMKVQEGQVLAKLDDTNLQAGLRLAQAQLRSAQAGLEETRVRIHEAELNLRRTTDLARSSISAQAELDRAEAEAAALKARLAQQEAQVKVAEQEIASWQQQIDDTIIRAPFTGIVTSKNAQPGEMISPISAGGGFTRTGICTIVDMNSLEIEIDVNESFINRVQPGQAVQATLDAYSDWPIPCKVIAIIPTADRQKSTVRVRVGFDKLDPRILPQMSIKVAFQEAAQAAASGPVLLIPKNAVQRQDGRDVVMVIRAGQVERRAISTSAAGKDELAVTSGLKAGDKVAVDWSKELTDGAPVKEIVQ